MAEFLKKNPIALRHCLLYIFLHEESIEDPFVGFCERVGPDIINKKEFRYWFALFEQGIVYLDEQPVADIREFIRNDKNALRVCIMYEWLSAKRDLEKTKQFFIETRPLPVFTRYMHFCKVIGDDGMEYREFEFWFYRFANGEFDLKFEREKERKIYELIDMPIDIMRNIVEYLDIVDRMSLERTSQSLRLFSQDQKIFHSTLTFEAGWTSAKISFGRGACISYENQENDCVIEFRNRENVILGVSSLKQAFQDFKKILGNPKLYINTLILWVTNSDSAERNIKDALKFTHLLHVKHLELSLSSKKARLNILQSLKPGYLVTIDLGNDLDEATIGELVKMDQWKQAKYFDMSSQMFFGPLHHLYHFHEFTAMRQELFIDDVREIKEILLKSPDFEKCNLVFRKIDDPFSIIQEFGGAIEGSIDTWRYPIPDSTEYFEIFVNYHVIDIERKKK